MRSRGRRTARATLLAVALAVHGAVATAEPDSGLPHAGRPLADALAALRARGAEVLYSSALVRPEMRVETEPAGDTTRELLAALLAPHGLAVREGPGGAWLVVPGRRPSPPARPAPRTTGAVVARPLPVTHDRIEVLPRLDGGSIHDGATLRRVELERLPTARDPWSVVTRAPGVVADRVDVGGSESGVQAQFVAPGASPEDNVYAMDGVNTTDMANTGFSALYYDFDQFERLQVSTGGGDVRTATAGVTVRLVTKSGGDPARGSARVLATDADGVLGLLEQRPPDVRGELAPGQREVAGDRVESIVDYGAEAGGPLVRDRLWAWGALGRNEIRRLALGAFPDGTDIESSAIKVNSRLAGGSLVVSHHRGEKRKENRGAGPSRSPETTWRQRGPVDVSKLEGTWIRGPRLVLSGEHHRIDGGFSLTPRAGANGEALLDADGVWRHGYIGGSSDRDSTGLEAEGSWLVTRGADDHALGGPALVDHAFDFGVSTRDYRFDEDFGWSGPRQAYFMACENIGGCASGGVGDLAIFERRGRYRVSLDYVAAWLQDTFTTRRWTWNAGLRLDVQDGRNQPGTVAANPALPELLPALDYAGADAPFTWRTASPRLAASYAIDASGKTLLRLSLGRFTGQLGVDDVRRLNPLDFSEVYYGFDDLSGDNIWQEGEPLELLGSFGLDPSAPLVSAHRTDPDLRPELTDELLVGIERSFTPEWVVGVNLTYRRVSDIHDLRPLVDDGATVRPAVAADYVRERTVTATLPDGSTRPVTFWALRPALRATGGQYLTTGDREREYTGLTFSFNRRLSARWTLRGHVNVGEARWRVPASFEAAHDPTDLAGAGDDDGALYAVQGSSERDDVFLQSTWSTQWSGFYQVAPERPWGFTVAASFYAREGYPIPYLARSFSAIDGTNRLGQATRSVDEFRTDDVYVTDLRVEKVVSLGARLDATVSVAVFNAMNESFVLRRERNLTSSRANYLEETLAPRIVRFGVRLAW